MAYMSRGCPGKYHREAYIKSDNNFHNNETDICNFGKGGGFSPAP